SASASDPNQHQIRDSNYEPKDHDKKPEIIETGKKNLCTTRLRARIQIPTSARTPSSRTAIPTVDGDIANLSTRIRYSSPNIPVPGHTINNIRLCLPSTGSAANSHVLVRQAQNLDH